MSAPNTFKREIELGESDILVMISDNASHYVYANEAFLKLRNWRWEDVKGKPSQERSDGNPKQVMQDMILSVRARKPWTAIYRNTLDNGICFWSRANVSPLFAHGKYAGVLIVHSKPTREEVEHIKPIYERMLQPGSNLMLRHGRLFKDNFFGRLSLFIRELGLRAHIWGGMISLSAVALTALAFGYKEVFAAPFMIAATATLGAIVAAGAYLVHKVVLPLRQTVTFANQIAAGDLSSKQLSQRSDEVGEIIRALTQMNINVRATVQDVRQGIHLIGSATADIANGAQDLSSRTDSQASNLAQTASSTDKMNTTVRNNSDLARQATKAAAEASAAAESGGTVVGSVVSTMQDISLSSKKMAEIIGAIDSIAFQTNILALNAAVEAARAGEQGRGFAVVAGEVRNLAQRSAQSAKEVRSLISEINDKVDNGFELVNSAGKTIDGVVGQARKVTQLVTNIADATNEQSSGIGQINQAVAQLDEMTQQNATLVQQNTSSAASLRNQAERLVDVVGVFKLSERDVAAVFSQVDDATAEAARAHYARQFGLQR